MSIVKNKADMFDTSVTIKRLLKDTPLVLGNNSYYIRWYHQVNNCYARLRWNIQPGESVFIKCEIEANAEGYIYGYVSGANIYVYKNGTTHQIQWRNGTTVVYSVNCDDKVHIIGWKGYIPDGQSLAGRGCMPFYDATTDTQHVITASGYSGYGRICGAVNSGTDAKNCIHSTGSWAIRLYEVRATATYVYGETILRDFHCYAAAYSASATNGIIVNTRFDWGSSSFSNGASISGITSSNIVVNFPDDVPGYGIQLHDLRYITSSGYNDIIPLMAEDGGIDIDAGFTQVGTRIGQAEPACTLTKDSDVRSFAMGLSGLDRPAGWTIANSALAGLMKIGRTPKWSIWNDAIDFGFYYDDSHTMHFNARNQTVPAGTSGASGTYCHVKSIGFRLENFDGYDTTKSDNPSISKFHPAFIKFNDSNLTIHNHNGAFVRCLTEDVMGGNPGADWREPNETPAYVQDNQVVFNFNKFIGGSISYRLGNLAPWNRTEAQMDDLGWKPVGVNVTLSITQNAQTKWVELANKHIVGYPYLTKDADYTTVKKPFREDGFNNEGFAVGSSQWTLFDVLKELGDEADMWADMNLVVNDASGTAVDVNCKNLVNSQKCHVKRLDDPYIDNENIPSADYTNYRMLVNSASTICLIQGGSLMYWSSPYYVYSDRANAKLLTRFDSGNTTQVYVPFIGCTLVNGRVSALDATGTNYIALIECYYVRHNTATDEDEYMYNCCIKSSINKTALQQNYPSCHTQWMGDANAYHYPFGLHQNGILQWGTIQGNQSQIYDYPDTALTRVDNTNLFDKVRFIAFNQGDLGFTTTAIPQQATIVTNIYNVTTAPAFFLFKYVTSSSVNMLWYPSCHEIATAAPAGSGNSARYYEFSQPCYRFNGDGSTSIEFYYISFVKNGNNFIRTAPAISSINNGGKLYIYKSTNLSTPVMIKNLADVVRNGSTPVLFNCDIIGLDGARDNAAYKLQMNLSTGLAPGETYYMQITN